MSRLLRQSLTLNVQTETVVDGRPVYTDPATPTREDVKCSLQSPSYMISMDYDKQGKEIKAVCYTEDETTYTLCKANLNAATITVDGVVYNVINVKDMAGRRRMFRLDLEDE